MSGAGWRPLAGAIVETAVDRPHDYESCTGCKRRRNAVELEQGCPGNRPDQWRGVSRGSPGVCTIVDAWWTSSARHGRAIEITRKR
jgi:hypothetical protein